MRRAFAISRKSCGLAVLISIILLLAAARLHAGETAPLKVIVDTIDKGDHLVVMSPEGDILFSPEQLSELGFREMPKRVKQIEGGLVSLRSLSPDVSFELDMTQATLVITADPRLLGSHIIDLGPHRRAKALSTARDSAFLNYALNYGMKKDFDFGSVAIPSEIGIRISDNLLYSNFSYTKANKEDRLVRLMTKVVRDDVEHLRRYTVGDVFASSSSYLGGSAILGGLSVSKDFSINPYLLRYQGLQLSGLLQSPSEVDLYINDASIRKEKLPPGEFEFSNLYGYAGSGDAVLVITDAFGRQETVVTPFYLSSNLLRPGLHDYAYNLGFRRSDFGRESFSYGKPTFIGYHRYGFSETFTGGLSGELDEGLVNIGATASFVTPWEGQIDTAAAASHGGGGYGCAAFVGYTYAGRVLSGNVSLRYLSREYTNVSLEDGEDRTRFDVHAGVGLHSGSLGSLSLAAQVLSKYTGGEMKRMTVFYNRSLGQNVNLSITASRTDEATTTYDVFAGLVFVLGKNHFGSFNVQSQGSRETVTFGIGKNQPRGTGISYKLTAETREDDGWRPGGRSYVQYRGPYGIYSAGYRRISGSDSYDLNLSGGIVFIDGMLYASRPIADSFGLVKVGDVKGVRVLYSNEEVAVTDGKGEAIVPSLLSYNDNKLSIDPGDIPVNYELTELDKYVSPPYRSGSVIRFGARKIQAFEGRLVFVVRGKKRPAESAVLTVEVEGKAVGAVIGKQGEFYLENLTPGKFSARVTLADSVCTFQLVVPESDEMVVDMGEVNCETD